MDNIDNKIQDYVDGLLSAEERVEFETEMAKNSALSEEVRLYQDIIKGIDIATDTELRETIGVVRDRLTAESFFNEEEDTPKEAIVRTLNTEKETPVRHLSIYKWAAAASVAILLAVGFWFFQPKNETQFNETYTAYFKPESKQLNEVFSELQASGFAADKTRNELLKSALEAYQSQKYDVAKEQLNTVLQKYPDDLDAQFYMAMTLMSLKDGQNAVLYLENLSKNSTSRWNKDAQWYLALQNLTVKEKRESAISQLKNIAADALSPYQSQAVQIIEKLK